MSDHRRLGSRNVPESSQAERREMAGIPIEASARSVSLSQPSLPPIQHLEDSNQSSFLSLHGSPQRGAKRAIPRLKSTVDGTSTTRFLNATDSKHRVTHACEPCRQRKTKCSGERPICKHCEDFKIYCVYEDGKRDRTKKEYNLMAAQVSEYEALLQDLGDRVCEADQAKIQRVLDKGTPDGYSGHYESSTTASSQRVPASDEMVSEESGTERHVPARKGSTESLDCISEDLNRSAASRATGFMGKNSEVNWLGELKTRTEHPDSNEEDIDGSRTTFGLGLDGLPDGDVKDPLLTHPLNESTYHCDDISLVVQDHVQAYHLPPRDIADLLLSCYLDSVHPAFPILGRTTFVKQYQAFYNNPTLQTGPLWLAILNLLFGIAARYSRFVRAEWISRADDEHTYFSRARLLGLGTDVLWDHGELQRIQVTGLTSFYLMATNQINRAFVMSGIAVRQALTLGLNLRNEDRKLADSSKEIRYRVWWAIAITERTLSTMTGRPTCFAGTDCSAPLPIPLDEESFMLTSDRNETPAVNKLRRDSTGESRSTDRSWSTSSSGPSSRRSPSETSTLKSRSVSTETAKVTPNIGLFFLYAAKLSNLSDDVLKELYRPPIMGQSWAGVQAVILRSQGRLERWHSALPAIFDFTKSQQDREFSQSRMCLGVSYYSTMMITHRPCLCKMSEKIPNETERGRSIDLANATSCVFAARSVVNLLPDPPNTIDLYQVTPWWNMVHHLMQAVTILMLEISLGAAHCPDDALELLQAASKGVGWLQSMSLDDMAAARAWRLSSELLQKVAPRVGESMDDRLRWPGLMNQEVPMRDRLPLPTFQDYSVSSGYHPESSAPEDYTGYPTVTAWEPSMFTSYDNYLLSNNPPTSQAGSSQDHQHQMWR
ncbi:MAG: hypothetical protein Q9209_004055 [Squamulea sp. 1 TL-2023]